MRPGVGQWTKPPTAWGPLVAGSCSCSVVWGQEAVRGAPTCQSWGGDFVGQEGGVQADTSALLPLTGSSVEVTSSVSVSLSVKWEEARE